MAIPDGIYIARALTGALGYTKDGKECVGVEFLLEGGQHITWYGYFTEKTEERTIESLRICGWTGTDLDNLEGIDTNEVQLVIESEEYDGKMRSKVRWVNRTGGLAMSSPLDEGQARSFAARMKGKVLAFDQKAGPQPTARPVGKLPPKSNGTKRVDDDIPF
jgi:hypothetical protein